MRQSIFHGAMLEWATVMPLIYFFLALVFFQTPKTGSVAGTVTNSVTGAPVRKARVTLRGASATVYTAATDASGRFLVEGVDTGDYFAIPECAGYQQDSPGSRPESVHVAEDRRTENVSLHLTPFGVIAGRVLDENGNPMAQMAVEALVETFGATGRGMGPGRATQTDDRGQYRMFDLPAGRYYLRVSNPGLFGAPAGRVHDQVQMAYAPTWFPGVNDTSQASATALAAGAEISVDIRIRPVRVFHIRGRASTPGGSVTFTQCGAAASVAMFVPILRDGTFDAAGIVPGNWCAVLSNFIDPRHQIYGRQTVTVADRDVNNVILNEASVPEIQGQVLVDGVPPDKPPQFFLQLESLDAPGRSVRAQWNPDNSFTMPNAEPGTYRVLAPGLNGLYLKSVRFNAQDMADGQISVSSAGGQLAVYLASDAGELNGKAPAGAVSVTVASQGVLGENPVILPVGREGNFRIRSLAPGAYQVLAWETADRGLLAYAEFRKLFDTRAASVTVHPKGHETVTVNAVTAAEIEAAKTRLR
jgi:hypothetical protein